MHIRRLLIILMLAQSARPMIFRAGKSRNSLRDINRGDPRLTGPKTRELDFPDEELQFRSLQRFGRPRSQCRS